MLALLFLLTMQAGMFSLTGYQANRTRSTGRTSPALCVHLSGRIELEERLLQLCVKLQAAIKSLLSSSQSGWLSAKVGNMFLTVSG